MNQYYSEFSGYLISEDREKCIGFVLSMLNSNAVNIVTLYEEILTPALNSMVCKAGDNHVCIWEEHIRSSIIRTIIECCYPYILRQKTALEGKVPKIAVICPDGEYHELGARMAADFFTLCGYNSIFIGGSTPKDEFINAINYLDLDCIAISVTNSYNLVAAKNTIDRIKAVCSKPVKIYAGGSAFKTQPELYKKIGADLLVNSFEDIKKTTDMLEA